MRFAIVALDDFDKVNSTVRRVRTLARGMASLGYDAHIVVPQRFIAGSRIEQSDGLTMHWGSVTTNERWTRVAERARARWETIRIVRDLARGGLDWLVLYNPGLEGVPLLRVAHRFGTKVAAEYCDARVGPAEVRFRSLVRSAWHGLADALVPRLVDLNIGISRALAAQLGAKAPRTPTTIVPPLVDCDVFQPQSEAAREFRDKWRIGETPIVAYLGSYWKVEGVSTLLEAVQALVADGERFTLVICGAVVPGLDCDDVSRLVRERQLSAQVLETGWLSTADVVAAMSAADVLVVPKTDDAANEAGVATKMMEYLSMGRPVVASRVGDVPLYLRDGHDALLCEPCNARELAAALRSLLHAPDERLRLGRNARRSAVERFDYRVVARQLDQVLAHV